MLRETRTFVVKELNAHHRALELRTPTLRVALQRGANVVTDFRLVDAAAPFVQHMGRYALTLVLEGEGRFDEDGRRTFLRAGQLMLSDERRHGTEAYAGTPCSFLIVSWDPEVWGAGAVGPAELVSLSARDLAFFAGAAARLEGPSYEDAVLEILGRFRAIGLPIDMRCGADLTHRVDPSDAILHEALAGVLSKLETSPAIGDLTAELGWNERLIHRRLADLATRYGLLHRNWRALLHHARMVAAFRLLAAPGATTEIVAARTGFRAASSLCHAFANAGLPSPGVLARTGRADVLAEWADLVIAAPERIDETG